MRWASYAAVSVFVLAIGQLSLAQQSLIGQVEAGLRQPAAAADAPEAAATPGYLGAILDDTGENGRGVRVKKVTPRGPAEVSGLRADDLITSVDGKPVANLDALDLVLDKAIAGQKLRLMIQRGAAPQSLQVTLGTRPASPQAAAAPSAPITTPAPGGPPLTLTAPGDAGATAVPPPNPLTVPGVIDNSAPPTPAPAAASPASGAAPPATAPGPAAPAETTPGATTDLLPGPAPAAGGGPSLGVTVMPMTEDARVNYGLTVRRGALITAVRPGSPADRAGLPVGAAVVGVNGRRVDSADDLVAAIRAGQPGQEIELTYYDRDKLTRKSVRLGPATAAIAPGGPPAPGPGYGGPSAANPGIGAGPRESPFGPAAPREAPLRMAPGGPADRLLGRIERMADNVAQPSRISTVYDPEAMAALQRSVNELTTEVRNLQERLKAVENRVGGAGANP